MHKCFINDYLSSEHMQVFATNKRASSQVEEGMHAHRISTVEESHSLLCRVAPLTGPAGEHTNSSPANKQKCIKLELFAPKPLQSKENTTKKKKTNHNNRNYTKNHNHKLELNDWNYVILFFFFLVNEDEVHLVLRYIPYPASLYHSQNSNNKKNVYYM